MIVADPLQGAPICTKFVGYLDLAVAIVESLLER